MMGKERPSATTPAIEEVPTVEDLYQKTTLACHAMSGLLSAVESSHPVIGWEDEMLPIYDLMLEIHVGLRAIYLRESPHARKEAEESLKEYVASFRAACAEQGR